MTDYKQKAREVRAAFVGNIFGGLVGGPIAIGLLMAWIKFEEWRLDHA